MPWNTEIKFEYTTKLPLPRAKDREQAEDVASHGMDVALSLLHDDLTMVKHDSSRVFEAIHPTDDDAVDVPQLASEFDVKLNPTDNPKDGLSEWKHYRVNEDVPIMFNWTKQITFHTAIRRTPDGMEALTDPGSGVTIYGKWTVATPKAEQDVLLLSESAYTHCNMVLGWYIKSTMQKTHDQVHAFVKEKFVETMSGKRWN